MKRKQKVQSPVVTEHSPYVVTEAVGVDDLDAIVTLKRGCSMTDNAHLLCEEPQGGKAKPDDRVKHKDHDGIVPRRVTKEVTKGCYWQ